MVGASKMWLSFTSDHILICWQDMDLSSSFLNTHLLRKNTLFFFCFLVYLFISLLFFSSLLSLQASSIRKLDKIVK